MVSGSLNLALIQVGILLSYLARFGDELFLYRNAWEPYFNIWAIFNLLRRMVIKFYVQRSKFSQSNVERST